MGYVYIYLHKGNHIAFYKYVKEMIPSFYGMLQTVTRVYSGWFRRCLASEFGGHIAAETGLIHRRKCCIWK